MTRPALHLMLLAHHRPEHAGRCLHLPLGGRRVAVTLAAPAADPGKTTSEEPGEEPTSARRGFDYEAFEARLDSLWFQRKALLADGREADALRPVNFRMNPAPAAAGSGPTQSAGLAAPWALPNVCPPAMRATVSSSFIAMRAKVSRMSRPEATALGTPFGPSGFT